MNIYKNKTFSFNFSFMCTNANTKLWMYSKGHKVKNKKVIVYFSGYVLVFWTIFYDTMLAAQTFFLLSCTHYYVTNVDKASIVKFDTPKTNNELLPHTSDSLSKLELWWNLKRQQNISDKQDQDMLW